MVSARKRAPWGEDRLTAWLARQPETGGLIGDDAAFLPRGGPFAVTVDSQREGVHFRPDLPPAWLARRLVAVNLSDLAAVGAQPRYAFMTVAAPSSFDHRSFFRALLAECRKTGSILAGGDLSDSSQINLTLTLLGVRAPRGQFLRRDTAAPEDRLWLGGPIGESALGLRLLERGAGPKLQLPPDLPGQLHAYGRTVLRRHLKPRAQLELGSWLARRRRPSATIDLSDGLARDLSRLCSASGVGCRIELESLPKHERFEELASWLECDEVTTRFAGGEDYVLLFTLAEGIEPPSRFGCHRIGVVTRRRQIEVEASGKKVRLKLQRLGFDHFEKHP